MSHMQISDMQDIRYETPVKGSFNLQRGLHSHIENCCFCLERVPLNKKQQKIARVLIGTY